MLTFFSAIFLTLGSIKHRQKANKNKEPKSQYTYISVTLGYPNTQNNKGKPNNIINLIKLMMASVTSILKCTV